VSVVFGTDGIRGVANEGLTPEIVLALGRVAARHLGGSSFLVGRDTRRSGTLLLAAFAAGVAAEGVDVIDLGVLPTPGIAFLAQQRNLPAAVVSASHNPFPDNGVKLLARGGQKLDDATERSIENDLDILLSRQAPGVAGPVGAGVGVIVAEPAAARDYIEALVHSSHLGGARFSVVLDCANGAASAVAPVVFGALGQELTILGAEPDGTNINAGSGSTDPAALATEVLASGADVGLGFDGDADRLIAVDANGEVVDGDQLIALFAFDLDERGALDNRAVAITVMSNLGLRRALEARGIGVVETPVGDRQVTDALESGSLVLGGEQSGHIVFFKEATTGDGIRTGIRLLELLARKGRPLGALAAEAMTRFPQVLRNVAVREPRRLGEASAIWREVAEVEASLGGSGRILVRASGTEEAVRVMVEAEGLEQADACAARLAAVVARELGAGG